VTTERIYDAVIVGGGPVGALVAKRLSEQGKDVLLLEAGRASGTTFEGWQSYVDTFYTALPKIPNAPYPENPSAMSPLATDIQNIMPGTPDMAGYQVEKGPLAFGSTYLRSLGGTSLHWLGTCPRMVPNDFKMKAVYGHGRDWPIDYNDLQKYYCQAEWEMGVSGNKGDQGHFGITFPAAYDYPMERIPQSYSDQVLTQRVNGLKVKFGTDDYPVWVSSLAQARNSIPRSGYQPVGAVGAPDKGQRCEGNASCIPICPVQAKYSALKTLAALDPARVTILTQAVATEVKVGENGRVSGLVYRRYDEEGGVAQQVTVQAKLYVLAAHAVENAKLLLASHIDTPKGAANSSGQVGQNLMDHPFFLTWALAPMNLGMFRGPGQTSEIPSFRDGAFRKEFAAFRIDLGNWGWDVATFPPTTNVTQLVDANVVGPKLRATLGDVVPRQLRIGYVIEQLPELRNKVTISSEYKDASGDYRPIIHYDISDYTRLAMVSAMKVSKAVFTAMGIANDQIYTKFTKSSPGYMEYKEKNGTVVPLSFIGSGHHMGTHRMGVTSTDGSVVDKYQRSWDHDNLYVVGCGSMPTSGSANPTLTAAAMSLMAADHMLTQLR
jgi:choline dehydrogenase-like flavoprotein